MALMWSKTILNPPLDLPYRGPVEYEGEVGMGDYPWIPQVINESRMFPKTRPGDLVMPDPFGR